MFFEGWHGVWRVLVMGICAYPALVLTLRIAGKRTLAKMNAFDLVVTVALGSTLSSILTSKELALVEGLVALLLLIGLQVLVAFLASRSGRANRVVKSEPRLLVRNGELLESATQAERITEDEIQSAVRKQGLSSIGAAEAVVLESSGEISVVVGARGASPAHPTP